MADYVYIAYVKDPRYNFGLICESEEIISEGNLAIIAEGDFYKIGEVVQTAFVSTDSDMYHILTQDGPLSKIIGKGKFYVRDNNPGQDISGE